jgi:hypothetical protein
MATNFQSLQEPKLKWPSKSKPDEPKPEEQGIVLRKNGLPKVPCQDILFGNSKKLVDYPLSEKVAMIGFKLHFTYWGSEEPYAPTCFDRIVQKIIYDKDS